MCEFCESDNNCQNKIKYGNYCSKHKRFHLVKDDIISYDNFTNKSSDYLKKDIVNTLISLGKNINKNDKKNNLYEELLKSFKILNKYSQDTNSILKLQKHIKKKNNLNTLKGIGFFNKNKCNNNEDFFSFEDINEINDRYFFSYQDKNKFIWFFDIRSFNKLIELEQGNPYTREDIPSPVVRRAKKLTEKLKLNENDNQVDLNAIKQTKEQIVKQKTVDLFASIEQSGYECNIVWFLNLNRELLKKLYRNLEDLWNYRLSLTHELKIRIAPPNGNVFTTRVSDINRISNKQDIQSIILNEVSKFKEAINDSDKKLGYMYFLIGLGMVSQECYLAHQWLMLANG